ncbi:MAG: Fe-S cluster assembly ATPase SufC [Enterobacteriaceae bacterium]
MLFIKNLIVSVNNKYILKNLNLFIYPGEVHAIMGPNGSGKSTLSMVLSGYKKYKVISGSVLFKNKNLFNLNQEERARRGLFILLQNPIEIPGVNNNIFLYNAVNSIRKHNKKKKINKIKFYKILYKISDYLKINESILTRPVNFGLSGGEKKKNEILQMMLLKPSFCIFDEIDSGLDVDTLKLVSNCINKFKNKKRSFIIITHNKKILDFICPDKVHILKEGKIVLSGNISLAELVEKNGYEQFT